MADLPSMADAWASMSDAVRSLPVVSEALAALPELSFGVPSKFLAVTGAAALGYYVDQKLLISSDLYHSGMQAVALLQAKRYARNGTLVPDLFEQSVAKWPHKPCMQFGRRVLSFREADDAANRVAHWGLQQGLQVGQTVALLMENRPEFVIVWLGLAKIGVVTALLNTHLQPDGLVHCAKIAHTKWMIVGHELADKLGQVAGQLQDINFHIYGDGELSAQAAAEFLPGAFSLDAELKKMTTERPSEAIRRDAKISTSDMALLIYTSGTTGLPKAARVNHFSIILRSLAFKYSMHLSMYDRLYCALPLYHTSGGNLAVGMMIFSGATLCISRRFSTTKFWDEVRAYDCTVIQYIGEMCRYLLNAPAKANDKENHVRAAFGNGLRPDVWAPFQERFGIPSVYEFYGSTEGPMGMLNACTTKADQGHLGRRGFINNAVTGVAIVRYDVEKDDYIRTKKGFLQCCAVNEPGELIVKVNGKDPARGFQGYYKNTKESSKKVLTDVFKKGDMYFRTGDLFKEDERHCWHFVDRVGDTFRWKGENVATNEVAEAVSKFPGLSEICIYGVEVPGNEGRACMAAMVFDDKSFDLTEFAQFVKQRLPSYAMPLFIRKLEAMSVTGTMKQEKAKLRKEGMDPSKISDRLWVFTRAKEKYEELTNANYHQVITNSRL
ncbi:Long-chain fatty acid transport protein 4 [Phytophthora fragariae]|uniref:Very long-chain fatty acid transport protein n=1 Tax=Phytophthora fragariae TaxID=53985 RepID=A0A6A4A4R4_9STRA|nr:Long-chain fatty acid transport protein 4 [Phytophthora fragariae]KAE8945578.1 Long-chain fatty acid transport protein 4 [Phytophthora fragariae]KAE9024695.1 Long-chain fatty acid transport protein 4 [Phytophthora fragariae]KAE9086240.1 Long-chain fatty acid transport protein 4 [Phytophthora fragariae]KAE9134464.1 Long-chain fatty acid transport protein 4 [Phytophthora fragariae]